MSSMLLTECVGSHAAFLFLISSRCDCQLGSSCLHFGNSKKRTMMSHEILSSSLIYSAFSLEDRSGFESNPSHRSAAASMRSVPPPSSEHGRTSALYLKSSD